MGATSPYWIALIISGGSLLVYLSGALISRASATNQWTDRKAFNLNIPKAKRGEDLFAISLTSAATTLSTVFAFFLSGVGQYGYWVLVCPALFGFGTWIMLQVYKRVLALGYLAENEAAAVNGSAGLLPYLGELLTGSSIVGRVLSAIVSLNLYALIVLELTVGVPLIAHLVRGAFPTTSLLEGQGSGPELFVFIIFMLLLLGYVFVGGFRAVIASDVWQYRTIKLAVIVSSSALIVYALSNFHNLQWRALLPNPQVGISAFLLNAMIANICVPMIMEPSWQRFRAFRDSSIDVSSAIKQSIRKTIFLWLGLILTGFLIPVVSAHGRAPTALYSPLVNTLETVRGLPSEWFAFLVFPMLAAAALSGMYSTADTSVSALLFLSDYPDARNATEFERRRLGGRYYKRMALIFGTTLVVYAVVTLWLRSELNQRVTSNKLLALVFSVFSSLLVAAPTIFLMTQLAPSHNSENSARPKYVLVSLGLGFLIFWTCTIISISTGNKWLGTYAFGPALIGASIPAWLLMRLELRERASVQIVTTQKGVF